MSKVYTTGEIIDILKPGQKARGGNELTDDDQYNIYKADDGSIRAEYGKYVIVLSGDIMNSKWQIVKEPVPVWEAIKAIKEKKNVRYAKGVVSYNCFGPFAQQRITIDDILNGTWYIEDDE